jgi:hypothetical protein
MLHIIIIISFYIWEDLLTQVRILSALNLLDITLQFRKFSMSFLTSSYKNSSHVIYRYIYDLSSYTFSYV